MTAEHFDFPSALLTDIELHPYPLLFVTVSGAHLYGFPSHDSDYDLRGVHVLPAREVLGLFPARETVEVSRKDPEIELDLVTHDARKFMGLLLKRNGYVLEQLYSPLVLRSTPEHGELKELAHGCITRWHAHHYLGFAETQWRLFQKEGPRRIKPLLYVFRVLLTGIHLMQTGQVEANLAKLNQKFHLSYIPDLIERKTSGNEQCEIEEDDVKFYQAEYVRLLGELEQAESRSDLPGRPSAKTELNEFLLRLRAKYGRNP